MASFTLYDISLFVHITAAVVGFGAAFAQSLTFPLAMRLDVRHLPYVHRLHLAINQRLVSPALGVVLLTGIYPGDRRRLGLRLAVDQRLVPDRLRARRP